MKTEYELCEGCYFSDESAEDICAQCCGKGIDIGRCTGENASKMSTIKRVASLVGFTKENEEE